ncbi:MULTISPECIES: DUF3618 domain-containing protein [Protofrankia]|uniref:DUF3618 domain-containing protein n=1 Tax=Protofrankia coriariae TaxID=1562887 RepID=A0ABR5F6J3_9ACTN|nr:MULTISPECIES: DUF3618 domain-containing protein [Protofrankia]KLL12243.1 hypothetical protein FrCorBMG51_05880 [Protofrankia coriariae]ONH37829.1 hypothetical protein BL254_02885 [Protofrankia sp. BMG5.30]
MGENPDKIRTDIELTRSRLSEELGLLSERVSPGRVAGRTAEDARSAVTHARERVVSGTAGARIRLAGYAGELGPKASVTAHRASAGAYRARQAADELVHRAGQNPQIAAGTRKIRESTGQVIRTTRSRAADNPGATRAVAAGVAGTAVTGAAVLTVVRRRRHRNWYE